jgi:predicted secreted hydrolase
MNLKLRKIDAVIIVVLLIIAGVVLFRAGYVKDPRKPATPEIHFIQDDASKILRVEYVSTEVFWKDIRIQVDGDCDRSGLGERVVEGNEITQCEGTITLIFEPTGDVLGSWTFTPKEIPPESMIANSDRVATPEDQGPHYKKALVNREWWYYTVVFSDNCELAGWTATISFNYMARNDLFFSKPDLLFVYLNSPDGKKYGGVVESERPLLGDYGILKKPVLQATSSDEGFRVTYEKSYVQGLAPNWHVHIEGSGIDENHNIVMDLQFFAPSSPVWTFGSRPIQNSKSNVASYVFLGCEVEGVVTIDGFNYNVNGIGHHEHTWASIFITKSLIHGWDWCQITLENGWNIYYCNYYFLPQIASAVERKVNPASTIFVTTDQGNKITILEDMEVRFLKSDQIFLLKNIPIETQISANPSNTQIILKTYNMKLNLNINAENTHDPIWKRFTNVGMKIGRAIVTGNMVWKDNYGDHDVKLEGIGTIWNMRT